MKCLVIPALTAPTENVSNGLKTVWKKYQALNRLLTENARTGNIMHNKGISVIWNMKP